MTIAVIQFVSFRCRRRALHRILIWTSIIMKLVFRINTNSRWVSGSLFSWSTSHLIVTNCATSICSIRLNLHKVHCFKTSSVQFKWRPKELTVDPTTDINLAMHFILVQWKYVELLLTFRLRFSHKSVFVRFSFEVENESFCTSDVTFTTPPGVFVCARACYWIQKRMWQVLKRNSFHPASN